MKYLNIFEELDLYTPDDGWEVTVDKVDRDLVTNISQLSIKDRVFVSGNYGDDNSFREEKGKVVYIHRGESKIVVEFDKNIYGHSGIVTKKKYKDGHCWIFYIKYMKDENLTDDNVFKLRK